MVEVKSFDVQGGSKETLQLDGKLFNSAVREHVLHEYAKGLLQNMRQGTASTKTRTMVRGGGRKPWRQKGTGRARAGSNTSPVWTGGGIVWGPHPKDYYSAMPKKLKRGALVSAFSAKAAEGSIRVVDLPELEGPKTKSVAGFLKSHGVYHQRVLVLYEGRNDRWEASTRNIKWLVTKRSVLVNAVDLLWAEHVFMTREALQKIEEVFG